MRVNTNVIKSKRLIFLGCLIVPLFLSCSKVKFYDSQHHENNFKKEAIQEQINVLKQSDPIWDSKVSHMLFDDRFVTLMSAGEYFPGVDIGHTEYRAFGSKVIWGTTDVSPDDTLLAWGLDYAYKYNTNILKLTKKKGLNKMLNERERIFIEHYKK